VGVVVVGVIVVVVVAQEVFYVSPDLRMSELCKSGSVCIYEKDIHVELIEMAQHSIQ
jgi:hypothetical protein